MNDLYLRQLKNVIASLLSLLTVVAASHLSTTFERNWRLLKSGSDTETSAAPLPSPSM